MTTKATGKSEAAKAVETYRRSDRTNSNLVRMMMKALEFAPQVRLPGRMTGTIVRYNDGSMAFVNLDTMEAMTMIKPDQIAVASEAMQESQGISTESWMRTITHGRALYVSQTICNICGDYRRPISKDELGRERYACEQGCQSPENSPRDRAETAA